jgi:hypothetical protein
MKFIVLVLIAVLLQASTPEEVGTWAGQWTGAAVRSLYVFPKPACPHVEFGANGQVRTGGVSVIFNFC